jgi:hypothetical protein
LEKQHAITTPRTRESLALKIYDAPDHLSTREHAFVDITLVLVPPYLLWRSI